MRTEVAFRVTAAQPMADQRLQERMTELKQHISAVLCKHLSELEVTTGETNRRVVLVDDSSSPSSVA